MRNLQDKIRNGIANSYYLRSLAKDDKLTREERDRIFKIIEQNDEKIKYYMKMNKMLKEKKDDRINQMDYKQEENTRTNKSR